MIESGDKMSNSNKKIKASNIVVDSKSEAGKEQISTANKEKMYKLLLWLGILCMIAYVVLMIVFVQEGRGSGRMHTGKMIMLASAITGGLGAAMLTVCTCIAKTKKMFSIAVAMIGIFCVSLYVTYMLLLKDYTKGTNTEAVGSVFAIVTVVSLLGGIILMIVTAIRNKIEEKRRYKSK